MTLASSRLRRGPRQVSGSPVVTVREPCRLVDACADSAPRPMWRVSSQTGVAVLDPSVRLAVGARRRRPPEPRARPAAGATSCVRGDGSPPAASEDQDDRAADRGDQQRRDVDQDRERERRLLVDPDRRGDRHGRQLERADVPGAGRDRRREVRAGGEQRRLADRRLHAHRLRRRREREHGARPGADRAGRPRSPSRARCSRPPARRAAGRATWRTRGQRREERPRRGRRPAGGARRSRPRRRRPAATSARTPRARRRPRSRAPTARGSPRRRSTTTTIVSTTRSMTIVPRIIEP